MRGSTVSVAMDRIAPAKTMKRNYMAFHTFDPDIAIDDLIEISRQRQETVHIK